LIGRDGDELLTITDVAVTGGLSPYELLTGLRARLPRRYVTEDAPPPGNE
jgi:alanine racemase